MHDHTKSPDTPARRTTPKQRSIRSSRITATRVVVAGNVVTAVAYGLYYGYASGIFN